jgi:hypothetical protein
MDCKTLVNKRKLVDHLDRIHFPSCHYVVGYADVHSCVLDVNMVVMSDSDTAANFSSDSSD